VRFTGLAAAAIPGLVGDGGGIPGASKARAGRSRDALRRGRRGARTRAARCGWPDQASAHPAVRGGRSAAVPGRRDRQGLLASSHPVTLAGGNGGRRGGDQPAGRVSGSGLSSGGAFTAPSAAGGRAAAVLRLRQRWFSTQRGDVLVGLQGRGGRCQDRRSAGHAGVASCELRCGACVARRARTVDGGSGQGMGGTAARSGLP